MTYKKKVFTEILIACFVSSMNFFLMQLIGYRYSLSFIVYLALKAKNVSVLPVSVFVLGVMDDVMMSSYLGFHAVEYTIFDFTVSSANIILVNKSVVCYIVMFVMLLMAF